MEFAAGRIEVALRLFRAVVDQWAAVGTNYIAKKSLDSDLSQSRVVVQVADDFSTQQPEVVHVLANGLRGETRFGKTALIFSFRKLSYKNSRQGFSSVSDCTADLSASSSFALASDF